MMRAFLIALAVGGLGLSGCAHSLAVNAPVSEAVVSEEDAIRGVLDTQMAAWNRGDIPAFMEGYWQSDDLRFASGGNITYGWTATRDRYLAHYDDRAKMGTLTFSDLVIEQAGADHALVFGHWKLARANDTPSGLFTLHFRKFEDGWKIVSDHTSSAD